MREVKKFKHYNAKGSLIKLRAAKEIEAPNDYDGEFASWRIRPLVFKVRGVWVQEGNWRFNEFLAKED